MSDETIIYGHILSDAKVTLRMSTYQLGLNEDYKSVWGARIMI